VSDKVNANNRERPAVAIVVENAVVLAGVLSAEISSKAHDVGVVFGLLNFDDDGFQFAGIRFYFSGEIDSVDGEGAILLVVFVFGGFEFQFLDLLADDGGYEKLGHFVVVHHVFEDDVVYWIGNQHFIFVCYWLVIFSRFAPSRALRKRRQMAWFVTNRNDKAFRAHFNKLFVPFRVFCPLISLITLIKTEYYSFLKQ